MDAFVVPVGVVTPVEAGSGGSGSSKGGKGIDDVNAAGAKVRFKSV